MGQQGRADETGQGMVEYGLLILLIAATVLGAFLLMGGQFGTIYSGIATGV